MIDWSTVLTAVLGSGVLTFALEHWLGSRRQQEIDRLKVRLDAGLHVSKAQFDKEFEVYEKIWQTWLKFSELLPDYYEAHESRQQELGQDIKDAAEDFRKMVTVGRPFYAPEVYKVVSDMYEETTDRHSHDTLMELFSALNGEVDDRASDKADEAYERLKKLGDRLCDAIRKRIRELETAGRPEPTK